MIKQIGVWILGCVLLVPIVASRADEPNWEPVATEMLQREKTGFGGLCGVVVDHTSGALWVNLSDLGMFHSDDQGQTWKRVSDNQPTGRTETPGCWLLDPIGKSKRMVTALVYGAPISVSDDQAATWKPMKDTSQHIDWCAVDWTDPKLRFVLAVKHEAGGLLLASNDGGQSFVEVGKGFGTGWIFDNQTAVVAQAKSNELPNPHLMRTSDGGRTFESCGQFSPVGTNSAQALPKWNDDTLYWLVDGGLIATTDKGESWKKISEVKDAQYGPIFGRDAQHLFVLTKSGPVESTDGGNSWSAPLAPPEDLNGIGGLSWLEYDPQHDTLYLMKMGSDLYRLSREQNCTAFVSEPQVVDLWPGKAPRDAGIDREESVRSYESPILDGPTKLITNVSKPTLTIYRPSDEVRNTGTAMLICPGGGYHDLFWELEGEEVAAWLNSLGMTGIILKYRCPRRPGDVKGEPPLGPLLDAQRAVSLVRSRAAEWGIDPQRIGMVGFSAGGHLALATATSFEKRFYEPIDAVDEVSCRPDFAVLCYSGYLKAKDQDEISPGIHIPADTPPIFLAHSSDDKISDAEHSLFMYLALKRAGVPAELHIYATGDHDFGVRVNEKLPSSWPELCVKWLRSQDLLTPRPRE